MLVSARVVVQSSIHDVLHLLEHLAGGVVVGRASTSKLADRLSDGRRGTFLRVNIVEEI